MEHMETCAPERMVDEMTDILSGEDRFFVLLGGLHSVTIPALDALSGTPVPAGLTWEYGEALIRSAMERKDVLAADVVEVAPVESSLQTEYNAAQLVYHILSLGLRGER